MSPEKETPETETPSDIRVLHLLPRAERATAERVSALATALAAEGVRSELLLGHPAGQPLADLGVGNVPGVTVTTFPWEGEGPGLAEALRLLLERLGKGAEHDLVHAHDPLYGPQLAAVARSLTGTDFLTTAYEAGAGQANAGERPGPAPDFGLALLVPDAAARDRLAAEAPGTPVYVMPDAETGPDTGADTGPDTDAPAPTSTCPDRHHALYTALAAGHTPREGEGPEETVRMALPDMTGAEAGAAAGALYSAKLSAGPHVEGFEREFAEWHGVQHAVAVNSAAAALFASLRCADIRGEVLVPSFTWAATANAVVAAGATPVWVEVDEDTLGLGPDAVAAAVGPRTEAVLPVHYAGHPCRIAELAELCRGNGLLLIEDAAEAAGARQNGAPVGSFGVGCFSFYGTKNMTTGGEGGMVTTGDSAFAARLRTLRAHGMRPVPGAAYPWKKEAVVPGYNFRMPEPLAAVGRRQLERLEDMNARRRAVAAHYDALLAERLPERVRPHRELPGFAHVYHMYVVRLRDGSVRDEVVAAVRARGVESSVHFDPPVHRHAYYRERYPVLPGALPVTDAVASEVVTLPLYTGMPEAAVERVVETLARALDEAGAR
ncbi:DegT/DnrJ/EryC1/StrS family aminotransferase [Streptomyces sp. ODS28]|uniref:DegT/DnrJ/EryC1/StrS family aminotransferase n=1 Tax=Streptomyces sp. ODS28 TaxID=3136688 RepID=UPI0031E66F90